jgi:hypothetical protein
MRFYRRISNSPRNENKMMHHPYLLGEIVFLASNTLLSSIGMWEKKIFNFKLYDLTRNECVKFGKHVDKQVNYKILWLEVSNNAQTLHNPPYF